MEPIEAIREHETELQRAVTPMMWSFMAASRRLRNDRLKRELRVRLAHPTVADALASMPA